MPNLFMLKFFCGSWQPTKIKHTKCLWYINIRVFNFCGLPAPHKYFNKQTFPKKQQYTIIAHGPENMTTNFNPDTRTQKLKMCIHVNLQYIKIIPYGYRTKQVASFEIGCPSLKHNLQHYHVTHIVLISITKCQFGVGCVYSQLVCVLLMCMCVSSVYVHVPSKINS